MDVKQPLPTHSQNESDDDDNASLTTSLPELSPTHSIASTAAMDAHDLHDEGGDEPPPYSAVGQQQAPQHPIPQHPVPQQDHQAAPVPQAQPSPRHLPAVRAAEPSMGWSSQDPRSSSTQSLLPASQTHDDSRRRLLLVYVHGFMGDETSFQSFPAHVHNLLSVLLAESHVVHTKIYPKYRSRRSITTAAEDVSKWLTPHENPNTDMVLLGHSMGGLVTAETILLPPLSTQHSYGPLRHTILGNLNFDVPFLGMHPGIIGSGLSSIFRPWPAPPAQASTTPSTNTSAAASQASLALSPTSSVASGSGGLHETPSADPNFNPSYSNDVRLPQRSALQSAAHFLNKHSRNLASAAAQVVSQHVEFGSCMYDFDGLKVRYSRVRMLEDESEDARATVIQNKIPPPRVRFANYYTTSTGRPKKPAKSSPEEADANADAVVADEAKAETEGVEQPRELDSIPTLPTENSSEAIPFDTASLPPDYSDIDFTSESESGDIEGLADLDPMVTPSRSDTGLSDSASEISETPSVELPLPQLPIPPVFRPPFKPPFTKDAYKAAIKLYKEEVHEYHRSIKAYHDQMQLYRKQEVRRLKLLRKKSMDSISSAVESHRAELLSRHEQRKQEFNARRIDLNARLEKARQDRQQMLQMLRPRVCKTDQPESPLPVCYEKAISRHERKTERREMRSVNRDERKLARAVAKEDRKRAKADSKALRKGVLSPSSKSGATPASAASVADSESLSGDTFFDGERDLEDSKDDGTSSVTDSIRKRSASDTSSLNKIPLAAPAPTRPPPALPVRSVPADRVEAGNKPDPDSKHQLDAATGKPKKERKFCLLPPRSADGRRDPCWVRVFMEQVDEVGAHCGLFFPRGPHGTERTDTDVLEAGAVAPGSWSERYARLVGDVAERVEGWVQEEMTRRVIAQQQHAGA